MPSRPKGDRPSARKRAKLPRQSDYTKTFVKSWARLNATGRFDMNDLKAVMRIIQDNEGPLPPERRDHALKDSKDWTGCRECHVHGDYLLVYKLDGDQAVTFVDVGTHAELFE